MFSRFLLFTLFFSAVCTVALVRADTQSAYDPKTVSQLKTTITQELSQKFRQFNGPRIELGVIRLVGGALPQQIQSVSLQTENARGQAQFFVSGPNGESAEVLADYAAWVQVRSANRRINPGERLETEKFNTQEINIASGMPYEQRGVLLPLNQELTQLETRQTILEGQFLVSNAVQKTPDVRRGDHVRVRLVSGDLNLSTQGTAAEPGYTNSTVRIVTSSTHRELTGVLQPGGIVEVKL